MKRFYLLFLILTVFLNCSFAKPGVIPDPNLAAAVREQLRLARNEPISEKDLRELEILVIVHKGVKNLTGLEKAANLRMLWPVQNEITDISPLADLTELDWLTLSKNKIEDITPIAN